jgi:hypothetical protein
MLIAAMAAQRMAADQDFRRIGAPSVSAAALRARRVDYAR